MDEILRAPARVAVLALLLTACATAPAGFDAGPREVVLRMSTGGGFVPQEFALSQLPEFTLYGDGRLITLGAQIEIYPQPALPPLFVREVTPAAVEQIVDAAVEAGLDENNTYRNDMIADASTTTFTLTLDDATYTTSAYALGFDDTRSQAEQRLAGFQADLTDLSSWIDEGELGEERAFEADAVRAWVGQYRPNEELPQEPADWPVPAQPLSSFERADEFSYACAAFEGADAEAILDAAANANALTPWRSDGERFALVFRPLLPDESGCPE